MKKYEKVATRIEQLINQGTLNAGDKVPSIRSMAGQMDVSIMTVLEGFRLLEDRGLIESRPQSGYYVRSENMRVPKSWARLPEAKTEPIKIQTDHVRIHKHVEGLIDEAMRDDLIPLGAGLPAPEFLASEQLSIRMARVVRNDPNGVNRYSCGQGCEPLRYKLSKHMLEAGCNCSPDEIIITQGGTQALLLALRSVTSPGDAVAVESPGFFGFYSLMNFLSLKAVEIPSDPQNGFSVDALEELLRRGEKVSSVLLSATISNPTGASMPEEEKIRLIKLCSKYNIPIIEDDTYGDISFKNHRPRALKSYDNDMVIYIGNFSKTLAPGYRIGWIAGGVHTRDILRCHSMAVLSIPLPNQLTIASFLEDGGMARQLRRLRRLYSDNMRVFQSAIASAFPDGTRTSNPEGGHFIWVKLPGGYDSCRLHREAVDKGISIAPGLIFSSRGHYYDFIRINCAITCSDKVLGSIAKLGEFLKKTTSYSYT